MRAQSTLDRDWIVPVASLPRKISMSAIIRETALAHGLSADDLTGYSHQPSIVRARWAAMRICRDRTGASLTAIGRVFNRHHTSVLNGINKLPIDQKTESTMRLIAIRAQTTE